MGIINDFTRLECENFAQFNLKRPDYCRTLSPDIAESWTRSRNSGVQIRPQILEQPFLSPEELTKIKEKNRILIDYTKDLFQAFKPQYSHTFHLLDKNGVLILTQHALSSYSPALAPVDGTVWQDEIIGTNAYSISNLVKKPIILPGPLHYSEIFSDLFSAATPVFGADGEIVGFLAFVQPVAQLPWEKSYQSKVAHAIGLITSIATAVEARIKLAQNYQMLYTAEAKLNAAFDLYDEGIITIDNRGIITDVNQAAAQMLKRESLLTNSNIADFLNRESPLLNYVMRGEKVDLEEYIGKSNQPFLVNVRPIINETKERLGAVLKIKYPRKKAVWLPPILAV